MSRQVSGVTLDDCEAQVDPWERIVRTTGSRVTGHVVADVEALVLCYHTTGHCGATASSPCRGRVARKAARS